MLGLAAVIARNRDAAGDGEGCHEKVGKLSTIVMHTCSVDVGLLVY